MISGSFGGNVIKSVAKPPPLKIVEGNVRKEFERLHDAGNSILTAPTKYIDFCGLLELTDRSCYHLELKNPSKTTILFNVRKPKSPVLFVKPNIGMVAPGKTVTLFFTFRGRCHRVPSDYCWIYSVYQIEIDEQLRQWINDDEFSTTNLRTVWNRSGRGDIRNILHLSCRFRAEAGDNKDCKRHQFAKRVFLNDTGDVLNTGTGEESRENPENSSTSSHKEDGKEKGGPAPRSLSNEELPATAESMSQLKLAVL